MSGTLHSRNRVCIAVGMQSENNVILKLVRAKADIKTNIMRMVALSGLGSNVTVAAEQHKPIAMNINQLINGTREKQKGEPIPIEEPIPDMIKYQCAICETVGANFSVDAEGAWSTTAPTALLMR